MPGEKLMKICSVCEADLLTSLDEYGDMRKPVCRSCFLEGEPGDSDVRILELEDEIRDLEEELEGVEHEIDDLESQKWDLKHDIRAKRKEIAEIKNPTRKGAARLNDLPLLIKTV
jgi:predicted  nucleic acid-binding Zn-ribbon protein